MDVTRDNFDDILDGFKTFLDKCDFISIDTELTGLYNKELSGSFDTPASRYHHYRNHSMVYNVLQYGVSLFKFDQKSSRYLCQVYNFYLFPHSREGSRLKDANFIVSSSAIDFLVKHNFDFNKTFSKGISFARQTDFDQWNAELDKRFDNFLSELDSVKVPQVEIPTNQEKFMDSICEKVDLFLADSDQSELDLEAGMNGFQRKLIYEHLPTRCSSGTFAIVAKSNSTGGRYLSIKKLLGGVHEQKKILLERKSEHYKKLVSLYGFSKIIELISQQEKPVIGHHAILDVMHTLNHFATELPENYEEFKLLTNSYFPKFIDTKHMARSDTFMDYFISSSLSDLKEVIMHPPFTQPKIDFDDGFLNLFDEESKYHDAGYDALVTGFCFAGMIDYIGRKKSITDCSELLDYVCKHFGNKLSMMNCEGYPYMNLLSNEGQANRANVYHITFPSEWRFSDINKHFQPLLKDKTLQVFWINNQTAHIRLPIEVEVEPKRVEALSDSSLCVKRYRDPELNDTDSHPDHLNKKPRLS